MRAAVILLLILAAVACSTVRRETPPPATIPDCPEVDHPVYDAPKPFEIPPGPTECRRCTADVSSPIVFTKAIEDDLLDWRAYAMKLLSMLLSHNESVVDRPPPPPVD